MVCGGWARKVGILSALSFSPLSPRPNIITRWDFITRLREYYREHYSHCINGLASLFVIIITHNFNLGYYFQPLIGVESILF